ncbi:flagellar protein FlbD [Clostridium sp. USBA 49]|uniref:flagellar FlbD family protein n=1 Tax=Clostridium TaxID=1485 RepID=UPI00099B0BF1|nr:MULTISPECIES: flagellar FlbD family protein [Clostridium]SKA72666.1 flagellar protein FlbD [Clostridium sp. USBA 49]
MIKLTSINNKNFILNAEHIEKIENVPESLITLINGNKYIVLESTEEIINKVIEYKNKIFKLGT